MESQTLTYQPPEPHGLKQSILYKAFITPGLLELWCPCGTKFGKTAGASAGMTIGAWSKQSKDTLYRWVAPIHPQAKIGLKYHRRLLHEDTIEVNKSDPSLTILHNQSRIEYKSGKFPEDLEGEGVDGGYCLDEAAKMVRQVYDSAKTTLTVTRAPLAAFSTPKGKNWFFHKAMEAREDMLWAIKNGKLPTKIYMTAPSYANPNVTQEAIDDMRKSLPERLFRQYVMAEFLDDGSTFLGFRDCYYTDLMELYEEHQKWFHEDATEATVVVGADWAKTEDWTVFVAICIHTKRVLAFERFHKRPYTQAIKQLVRFCERFKELCVVFHDKTGVGQPIDDQLAYTDLAFEGVTFTNRSKTEMVNNLITRIEHKELGLPHWNVLDLEMDSYEVTTNAIGTMSFSAPSGLHDDTVCALMLANAALEQYADRDWTVRFIDDLNESNEDGGPPKDSLEGYYSNLDYDEDF